MHVRECAHNCGEEYYVPKSVADIVCACVFVCVCVCVCAYVFLRADTRTRMYVH